MILQVGDYGRAVGAVAVSTLRESIRAKLFYALAILIVFIMGTSMGLGSVTIGDPIAVLKDFARFSISISILLYCVGYATAALHQEIANRIIFNVLSRPIPRSTYLLGKFTGMCLVETIIILACGLPLIFLCFWLEGFVDFQLVRALAGIFLEGLILSSLAILGSSFLVTPLVVAVATFCSFVAGRSSDYILRFADEPGLTTAVSALLRGIYWAVPHLSDMVSMSSLEGGRVLFAAGYAVSYSGVALCAAVLLFNRREFE
jgi:ABC-type transport system involved in multi-copper enzyme maturation permease subunit